MNDNQLPPSIEQWRSLYHSALKFKEMAPWEWMWDSQLFGVMNPVNEEIGYCCIMGQLGEHYALAVYQGAEGLDSYFQLQSVKVNSREDSLLTSQKCLMASFEDNKFLYKEDKKVIKALGLTFRGRNAWPVFRNYAPGYFPWFLTALEVEFLTLCLEQSMDVAARVKVDPARILPSREHGHFVRVPKKESNQLLWSDQWLQPANLDKVIVMRKNVDEKQMEMISRLKIVSGMIWEIDQTVFPTVVREKKERPFCPMALLIVDRASEFILKTHLSSPQKFRSEFIDQFLSAMEQSGVVPEEIHLKNDHLACLLEPFCDQFRIRLNIVKKFEVMQHISKEMKQAFSEKF